MRVHWWDPPSGDEVQDQYIDSQLILAQAWYPEWCTLAGSPEHTRITLDTLSTPAKVNGKEIDDAQATVVSGNSR